MDATLLRTKLFVPPTPPGLLHRPRLFQQLDQALAVEHSTTLISTPAGYGKTTLLSSWIRASATPPVAWLTLEDDDSDPARFLAYLVAAIESVQPEAGRHARDLLQTFHSQPSLQTVLTEIINILAQTNAPPLLLVLDDYHVIENQTIHQGVEFLLHHLPPRLHLVIASRVDPPWALARLRAQHRLNELRINDLCFTVAEITDFFNQINRLALSAEAIEALQNRTEGWIASLQLAALSLQRLNAEEKSAFITNFTSSHHYIFDFLAEELFRKQSAPDREFLLQTSILDHLTAPLCAAVTAQANSQTVLEQLHHANLLIAQDDHRQWYRYHHLFADFLRHSLDQHMSPAQVAELYGRASHWCEANGYLDEAIQYALAAQAWDTVVRLIKTLAAPVQFMRYAQSWQRWVAALPEAVWQRDLELAVGYAWALMSIGQWQVGQQILGRAEATAKAENNDPVLGKVHTARSYLNRMLGDIPGAMEQARQALVRLSPDDVCYRMSATRLLGLNYLRMGKARASAEILTQAMSDIYRYGDEDSAILGLVWLGQAQFAEGKLHQVAQTHHQVRHLTEMQHRDPPLIYYVWATMLYYEWNELTQAAELWEIALAKQALLRNRSFPEYFVGLARLQWVQGKTQAAYATLHQAQGFAQQANNNIANARITAQHIQFKLTEGDLETGLAWLEAHPVYPDDKFIYLHQDEYLTRIRVLIHQHTPASLPEAGEWLDKLLPYAAADGRQSDHVKLLVLKAIVTAYTNNLDQALLILEQALTLAEPENYIRTFLDEGQPLIELLQRAIRHNIASAYAARLLKAGQVEALWSDALPSSPQLLSEREIEVLKLLSQAYSPQEISDALIISVHTARTHIKHIYHKLDAPNRKQAISKARKLNLV